MENPYIWNTAIKLPLSGYWYGSLASVGSYSRFWSPVVYNSYVAYIAAASSVGDVGPDNNFNRDYGDSVRCVAR